jgi:hypothetical protein
MKLPEDGTLVPKRVAFGTLLEVYFESFLMYFTQ